MKQTRKRRILIVDDSEMNREILTGILEDEYDIVEAEDGKKAIAIMEEGLYSFSIVLLDITMPELDGFGVLQVMQQRNWLKELPVIIISAETSNEYIGHAYEMGVSDYFSRPFDARIVNTRVRNTIALFERDYIDQVTGGGNRKTNNFQSVFYCIWSSCASQFCKNFQILCSSKIRIKAWCFNNCTNAWICLFFIPFHILSKNIYFSRSNSCQT